MAENFPIWIGNRNLDSQAQGIPDRLNKKKNTLGDFTVKLQNTKIENRRPEK